MCTLTARQGGAPVPAGSAVFGWGGAGPARPVPTAELTVHFTDALDAAPVEDRVLVRIRTEYAGGGWVVEDSALWSTTGRLLALARQARVLRNGSRAAHGGG